MDNLQQLKNKARERVQEIFLASTEMSWQLKKDMISGVTKLIDEAASPSEVIQALISFMGRDDFERAIKRL